MTGDALVIFTPSGRRGRFPTGTTVLDAARSLGVDIDSVCGGRGICGRCQVTQGLGEFAKHGITSAPAHLSAFADARGHLPRGEGPRRGPAPVLHRHGLRRRADRRPAGEPGPPPGGAQGPRRADLHRRPGRPPPLRRGDAARAGLADRRPRPACSRRSSASGQLTGLEADLAVIRALQPALEAGDYRVTVAVHEGRQVIGVWPGLHEIAPTASPSMSARRRSPATWPTWPTARSLPATA